ncbi:MAG: HD domain-containing protein [Gammaproteobacteria bacterium]|nr:HD domain-containing protein [Gammaproteobacteria bacterium]
MVKVNEGIPLQADGQVDLDQWMHQMAAKGYFQDLDLLRSACDLTQLASQDHAIETGESCLQHGLAMADVLANLEVDQETMAAALIYAAVHYAELSTDDVAEQFGEEIAHLVRGVEQMSALSQMGVGTEPHHKHQIDNIRKMLLAMVDDVRVVLIKLADRLCVLRSSAPISVPMRQKIATEVMTIYAPLANRLGIGSIKWEMEDLAFRYLQPEAYQAIAKNLKTKRLERDRYVQRIVDLLKQEMHDQGFEHFAVYGRSKHIHSIHRKMMQKHLSLEEIYDATAVRILVDSETQCYAALDLVHNLWSQVLKEYDDYIMKPKSNGYQSLHTAVEGPEQRVFEVQIRTFQMHDLAEMGVAAHWKYKEGEAKFKASHERKIEWLRQVLAWHHDVSAERGDATMDTSFLDDRVYVFTPDGDILDLQKGVTALDFAYHVHTELGHRCRGAKVNSAIVPLTYELKTGDKVEVLTGKEAKPSRDWINPHLHYLKSSRSKSKVLHWFKTQDFDKNCVEGRELLDKELKTLGIKSQ